MARFFTYLVHAMIYLGIVLIVIGIALRLAGA